MTDRMWYGDAGFEQEGQWRALYPAMKHLFIAAAVLVLSGVIAYLAQSLNLFTITILAGYLWPLFGFVYYQVESFKYLTAHKVLDIQVRFTSEVFAGRVVGIIVFSLIFVFLFCLFAVGGIFKGAGLFGVVALGDATSGTVLALVGESLIYRLKIHAM